MIEFDYKTRVRYSDIDFMGIVYYSRYYEFFEAARTDMLRQIGIPYSDFEKMGYGLPVAESHCEYKKGAEFDNLLNIKCIIENKPGARIKIDYKVTNADTKELIVIGYTIHAFLNSNKRPCKPPKFFIEILNKNWL